nr:retrovirus-related Pol polyprotein from transposon TNT 1-94 [Tanacetum cinerariifolium]
MVNISLKKLKQHLAGFDVVIKERTMLTTITKGSWGFEHTKACFRDEIIPFVKALKDLFNTFDQYLIELTEVQNVFHQMEHAMEQHRTIKFRNDHVEKVMGYGDYQIGNVMISKVYYMEGVGHNLFSVGKFYDSDLEVAFCQHTCYIRNLEGVDQLTGSRGNNLYTLSLRDMMAHNLVRGLPKLKFEKDHLCSACAMGKSKKKPHKPKSNDTNQEKLYLLHMDLCGPMSVVSVNGKNVDHPAPEVIAQLAKVVTLEPSASTGSPSLTTIDQDAPSLSNSQTTPETQPLVISNDVEEDNHDLDVAHMNNDPFVGIEESPKTPTFHDDLLHEYLHEDTTSQESSSNIRLTHIPFESPGR